MWGWSLVFGARDVGDSCCVFELSITTEFDRSQTFTLSQAQRNNAQTPKSTMKLWYVKSYILKRPNRLKIENLWKNLTLTPTLTGGLCEDYKP